MKFFKKDIKLENNDKFIYLVNLFYYSFKNEIKNILNEFTNYIIYDYKRIFLEDVKLFIIKSAKLQNKNKEYIENILNKDNKSKIRVLSDKIIKLSYDFRIKRIINFKQVLFFYNDALLDFFELKSTYNEENTNEIISEFINNIFLNENNLIKNLRYNLKLMKINSKKINKKKNNKIKLISNLKEVIKNNELFLNNITEKSIKYKSLNFLNKTKENVKKYEISKNRIKNIKNHYETIKVNKNSIKKDKLIFNYRNSTLKNSNFFSIRLLKKHYKDSKNNKNNKKNNNIVSSQNRIAKLDDRFVFKDSLKFNGILSFFKNNPLSFLKLKNNFVGINKLISRFIGGNIINNRNNLIENLGYNQRSINNLLEKDYTKSEKIFKNRTEFNRNTIFEKIYTSLIDRIKGNKKNYEKLKGREETIKNHSENIKYKQINSQIDKNYLRNNQIISK